MSWFKKFLIALLVATLLAVTAGTVGRNYADSLPRLYVSSVTFNVNELAHARDDLRGFSQTQQEDLESRIISQQILSDTVLDRVADSAAAARTLRQNIAIEPAEETRLVKVSMKSYSPEMAADLANRVVASFAKLKRSESEAELTAMIKRLNAEHLKNKKNVELNLMTLDQMDEAEEVVRKNQQDVVKMHQGLLEVSRARLTKVKNSVYDHSVVDIVAPAVPARHPAYPNTTLITAFSAAGGSLVGFMMAVGFFAVRRKV